MHRSRLPTFVLAGCVVGSLLVSGQRPIGRLLAGESSVAEVVRRVGQRVERRLRPRFQAAGIELPLAELRLVAYKREKRLELWARSATHREPTAEPMTEPMTERSRPWVLVQRYPVLAASGVAGPKLREGDRQVPEGLYAVEALNPNSSYHLSLKLDYPNAFDRARAIEDGRADPGSDIFIHGKNRSIGCLAVGDEAIEDLFVLVSVVGLPFTSVIVAPYEPDPGMPLTVPEGAPEWTRDLYLAIDAELGSMSDR